MKVKESFSIVGLPTTWGNRAFKNWMHQANSIGVSRLKMAGAVILGKTNVPFMLTGYQSCNEICGKMNSPWNISGRRAGHPADRRLPSAGFVPMEIGSDITSDADYTLIAIDQPTVVPSEDGNCTAISVGAHLPPSRRKSASLA